MFTFTEYAWMADALRVVYASGQSDIDALQTKLRRISDPAREVLPFLKPSETLLGERVKIFETLRELKQDLLIMAPLQVKQSALVWLPEDLELHIFKIVDEETGYKELGRTAVTETRTLNFAGGLEVVFAYCQEQIVGQSFDFAFVYNTEYGEEGK